MKVIKNYSLSDRNSLKLDSNCAQYIELTTKDDVLELLSMDSFSKDNFFTLGEGSNVILPQEYSGTVLHPGFLGFELTPSLSNEQTLKVGAGESWASLIAYTLENGLLGLENLTLIPGSVGAAPIQNIGAYGVEVCEYIESLEVFNFDSQSFENITAQECKFSYRDSLFKRKPNTYLIISVSFTLNKKAPLNFSYGALKSRVAELNINESDLSQAQLSEMVASIRRERLPDPISAPNVGSFFKNPIISEQDFALLIKRFPNLVHFPQKDKQVKLSAAWLIDSCGWKGRSKGVLQVSELHALVLINKGKSNKEELLDFAKAIQDDVQNIFSLRLEIEPVLKPA